MFGHSAAHYVCSRSSFRVTPGLRGLALGYTLLPTSWVHGHHPRVTPGLRGLALGYTLLPTSWANTQLKLGVL